MQRFDRAMVEGVQSAAIKWRFEPEESCEGMESGVELPSQGARRLAVVNIAPAGGPACPERFRCS